MKNDINEGDKVVFLYDTSIMLGKCIKVNKKTYKIEVPAQRFFTDFVKNVDKHRVANINDKFTVVWEADVGVEGRYRIDYDTYPSQNTDYTNWLQPYKYITENK